MPPQPPPRPRQNLASTSWAQHMPRLRAGVDVHRPFCPRRGHRATCGKGPCFLCAGDFLLAWLRKKGGRGSSRAGFTETHSCLRGRLSGRSGAGVLCGAAPDGDLYPALPRAGVPSSGRGRAWGKGTPHKGHSCAAPAAGKPKPQAWEPGWCPTAGFLWPQQPGVECFVSPRMAVTAALAHLCLTPGNPAR